MPLVNGGRNLIASALRGTGTDFDGTNARIGVGSSSTAYAATQTDLQTPITRVVVDSAPTVTNNEIELVATFGDGVAEDTWNEWGVFNSNSANTGMLSRKVESLGTKASGQTWVATVTLTVNVGT